MHRWFCKLMIGRWIHSYAHISIKSQVAAEKESLQSQSHG